MMKIFPFADSAHFVNDVLDRFGMIGALFKRLDKIISGGSTNVTSLKKEEKNICLKQTKTIIPKPILHVGALKCYVRHFFGFPTPSPL